MERGDVPTAVRRQKLRGKQARLQALPTAAMEAETLAGEGFVRGADGLVPLATDARRQHVHYTHVRTHSPSDARRLWASSISMPSTRANNHNNHDRPRHHSWDPAWSSRESNIERKRL